MYAWIGSAFSSRSPELLFALTYTHTAASCRRRSTRTSSNGSASRAGSRAERRRWRWRSRSGSRHSGCRYIGREIWLRRGGVLYFEDMLDIATLQVEREEALSPDANRWLICDTSPLTTRFYCLDAYGRSDPRLDALAERPYARVILAVPISHSYRTARARPMPIAQSRTLGTGERARAQEYRVSTRRRAARSARRGNSRAAWRPPSRFPIIEMAMNPSARASTPSFAGVTPRRGRRAGARTGAAPARARGAGGERRASCRPRRCASCTRAASCARSSRSAGAAWSSISSPTSTS